MPDIEFVDGLRVFAPNPKAPEFIKASLVVDKAALAEWLVRQPDEVRFDIKESKKGAWYCAVNNWRPQQAPQQPPQTPYQPEDDDDNSVPF